MDVSVPDGARVKRVAQTTERGAHDDALDRIRRTQFQAG